MPTRTVARHDEDFFTWTRDQATALRHAARSRVNLPDPIDFENVAEEIESLGVSQLRELRSRYLVLLVHLLKWQHQLEKRTPSWRTTIRDQRREIADLLELSPGLKPKRRAALAKAYARAREDVAAETGLPLERLPEACAYTLEEAESAAFWPGEE